MKAALASAAAALIAPSVEAAVTATLLVHEHSNRTWFGDSAIAMQSPSELRRTLEAKDTDFSPSKREEK